MLSVFQADSPHLFPARHDPKLQVTLELSSTQLCLINLMQEVISRWDPNLNPKSYAAVGLIRASTSPTAQPKGWQLLPGNTFLIPY